VTSVKAVVVDVQQSLK